MTSFDWDNYDKVKIHMLRIAVYEYHDDPFLGAMHTRWPRDFSLRFVTKMTIPLFILAPPRTFTSIICTMIGQHPQLLGLPDVNLFAADTYGELARLYLVRQNSQHGLLRAVAELGLGDQTKQNIEVARSWLDESPSVSTADLFQDIVEWSQARAPVDKSTVYVLAPGAFARIRRAYPNARFIHLVRHPRGTCASVYKSRRDIQRRIEDVPLEESARTALLGRVSPPSNVENPDTLWLQPHKRILAFLSGIPPELHLQVRAEDIMAHPDRHLAKIAEWLAIRTDSKALEEMRHPERSPFACIGPPNAKFGNDPRFLERPTLRAQQPKPIDLSVTDDIAFRGEIEEYAHLFGY